MKKTESKLGKRFLAILLAMLMLLSMMPASALAADLNPDAGIQADEDPQTVDKSELEVRRFGTARLKAINRRL